MAAVTSVISAGVALAGTGMSMYQLAQSEQDKKKAESAANSAMSNYANIKEQDMFSGLQVPTMGAELQQQSADRATSQALQMVSGTPEMAIGATPGLVQANMEQTREIGADLDAMKYQRDLDQTKNRARIELGRTGRMEDYYSSQLDRANTDRQQAQLDRAAGIKGIFDGATDSLVGIDKLIELYPNKRKGKRNTPYDPVKSNTILPNYGTPVENFQPTSIFDVSGLGYQNQVIPNP